MLVNNATQHTLNGEFQLLMINSIIQFEKNEKKCSLINLIGRLILLLLNSAWDQWRRFAKSIKYSRDDGEDVTHYHS